MKKLQAMKNEPSKNKRIRDRNRAIRFAAKVLRRKSRYVILEVETTGLGPRDVIISMAVTNLNGAVLLDTLVKPVMKSEIPGNVTILTGISMEMLRDAPIFMQLYPKFREITAGKTVLTYDTGFAGRYLKETLRQEGLRMKLPRIKPFATRYAMFRGEWLPERNTYKIPLLHTPDRTLTGDCKAALNALEEMAGSEVERNRWWF